MSSTVSVTGGQSQTLLKGRSDNAVVQASHFAGRGQPNRQFRPWLNIEGLDKLRTRPHQLSVTPNDIHARCEKFSDCGVVWLTHCVVRAVES